uniref:COesterase domain-containing protein n=1 Tax=Anisakis simplex TaxID=6269 RepID=A0A0M3J872_ANISI
LTLFGQSAGAASVSAHTYSPLSQHLFQNAILESGTIMTCLNGVFGKSKNSQHIAKIVCNITDWPPSGERLTQLYDCMMRANYEEFLPFEKTDLLGWKMSVDGYFLPGTPEQLHSKRPNIPIILGTCKDEWSFWDLSSMAAGLTTVDHYSKHSLEQFFDVYGSYFGPVKEFVLDFLLAIYQPHDITDNDHIAWLQTKSNVS